MSGRQRDYCRKKISKKKTFFYLLISIIFFLFLIFLLIIFIKRYSFFAKSKKLTIAVSQKTGEVVVLSFDKEKKEVFLLDIPKDTLVSLAGNMGETRLKNVLKRGEYEGWGGKLLSYSLMKNFSLPIVFWSEEGFLDFIDESITKRAGALFGSYKTNLSLLEKIDLFFFLFNFSDIKIDRINLAKTTVLGKKTLQDGEEGYYIKGKLPILILSYFVLPFTKDEGALRLKIIDKSDKSLELDLLSRVFETIGFGNVLVENGRPEKFYCKVYGVKEIVYFVNKIFNCQKEDDLRSNFELVIEIGEDFVKSF